MQRHKDDQLSVLAWVTELQSLDYNPVVMFKAQGSETNDNSGLKKEDFSLVI